MKRLVAIILCIVLLTMVGCAYTGESDSVDALLESPTSRDVLAGKEGQTEDADESSEAASEETQGEASEDNADVELEDAYLNAIKERTYNEEKGTGMKFALIMPNSTQGFQIIQATGVQDGLREGDTLVCYAYNYDTELAVTYAEDVITQGFDGCFTCMSDADLQNTLVGMISDAGIPCMSIDNSATDFDSLVGRVISDNFAMGYYSGQALVDAIVEDYGEASGKVIAYAPVYMATVAARYQSFLTAMEEYPEIEVILIEDEFVVDTAIADLQDALTANPDTIGFWGACDIPIKAMVTVCEEAGRDDIVVGGIEVSLWMYEQATENGTVDYGLDTMGYSTGWWGMYRMYEYLDGKEIPFTSYVAPIAYQDYEFESAVTWKIEECLANLALNFAA